MCTHQSQIALSPLNRPQLHSLPSNTSTPIHPVIRSTCSLACIENDGVVSKALERCPPGSIRVVQPTDPDYYPSSLGGQAASLLQETFSPDATKYGVLLLPDVCQHGPIYVCVLEKKDAADDLRLQMLKVDDVVEGSDEEEDLGDQ